MGKEFKYRFKQLPLYYKLTGMGSIIALLAVFLPWISYDTKGSNGLQGLTYLIGYVILFLSLVTLIFFLFRLFDKKHPKIPCKEHTLYMIAGGEIMLLSMIAFSIYSSLFFFTSKYSIELGVSISTIGGLLVLMGGYLAWKEERQDNVKKTFIHMPEPEPDKDLERYLKKSKDEHKMLSAEESIGEEKISASENRSEGEEQPPNLKMFE